MELKLFGPSFNSLLQEQIENTLVEHATSSDAVFTQEQAQVAVQTLRNNLFARIYVLFRVKQELRDEGISVRGKIDWEAIAEFLKVIIPLIMELIGAFT